MADLPPFLAEHAPRPARVDPETPPWPWCSRAGTKGPPEDWPSAPMMAWVWVAEPTPHDAHPDNGGYARCGGVPGTVPGTTSRQAVALLDEAEARYDDAARRLQQAQRDVERAQRDVLRAEKVARFVADGWKVPTS